MAIPFEIGGQRADLHTDAEYKELIKQTIRESGGTITPTDPDNPGGDEPPTEPTNTTVTQLTIPTQIGTLTYNGRTQSPEWSGFNDTKMTINGETEASDAGEHTVTFTPKTGYEWTDGSNQPKTVPWTLQKAVIDDSELPTQSDTIFYSKTAQTPTWSVYDETKMTLTVEAQTNAGDYSATLNANANYQFADGSTSKTLSWQIKKVVVEVPTVSNTNKIYNKTAQGPTISPYDSQLIEMSSGTTSETNVGNYSIVFTLKDAANYEWPNGTSSDKVFSWSISPLSLSKPTASTTSFSYDGNTKALSIINYDAEYMNQSGTVEATNVGNYSVTHTLKDTTNTRWSDNTTASAVINWSIGKQTVAVPTLSNATKTYNGSAQSPTISTYDTNLITVSGNSQTNAGDYNVTFALKDKDNYKWPDSTTDNKTAAWKINKATPTLTLSDNEFVLSNSNLSKAVTVTTESNGALSVIRDSTDFTYINTSVSNKTVTLSVKSDASYKMLTSNYYWLEIGITETANYNAATKAINYQIQFVPSFDKIEFSDMKTVVQAGIAANYWNIGDYRQIELTAGTVVDGYSISSQKAAMWLLDFDHNKDIETASKPSIHCLVSNNANKSTLGTFGGVSATAFCKNSNDLARWSTSNLRTVCSSFRSRLPSDLSAIIKQCTKYSPYWANEADNVMTAESTKDYIWTVSNAEIAGWTQGSSPSGFDSNQTLYSYRSYASSAATRSACDLNSVYNCNNNEVNVASINQFQLCFAIY